MANDREMIFMIEELAANSWPAPVQQHLEGWRLRAASGVTRRANSVLSGARMPVFEGWMDEVTSFYASRNLPVRFLVSDASPGELDGLLEGLGYVADAHSSVQVASREGVLARSGVSGQFSISSSSQLTEEWLDLFVQMESARQDKEPAYWQIMSGIGPSACFLQVVSAGRSVGIGMAVTERGWAGLYNIGVAPDFRLQGVGTEIVRSLAKWSAHMGAEQLYLQVMKNNVAALALYKKLGFSHLYAYHYRTLE